MATTVSGSPPPSGRKITSTGSKSSQSTAPRQVVLLTRVSHDRSAGVMASSPWKVASTDPSRIRLPGGGFP